MGKIYAISFKVDGINYAANGDTAIVKGYTEIPEDGILSIKSSVTYGGKDYVVTTIQNSAFLACVELRTLIIPSSIKYIYSSAFENCVNMIKLVLLEGNDKLYVLDKAFSNCNIQEAVIGRDLSNSIFS